MREILMSGSMRGEEETGWGKTWREGERKRTLAVGADEPEQYRASRPHLLRQEPIWSPNVSRVS